MNRLHAEEGVTLIEVLVALLILGVGLLGAAAAQIRALQYTDAARMSTQASFIAQGLLEQVRAGSAADYAGADFPQGAVAGQDLHDFAAEVVRFAGPDAEGRLDASQGLYRVRISWSDARAAGHESRRNLELASRMAPASGERP